MEKKGGGARFRGNMLEKCNIAEQNKYNYQLSVLLPAYDQDQYCAILFSNILSGWKYFKKVDESIQKSHEIMAEFCFYPGCPILLVWE